MYNDVSGAIKNGVFHGPSFEAAPGSPQVSGSTSPVLLGRAIASKLQRLENDDKNPYGP